MLRVALLLVLPGTFALAAEDALAVKGLDPVLLVDGVEKAGREDLTHTHKGYLYRFSTAETQSAFRREPGRFEIQYDGACARMGPLSGSGDPARFLVHDRRIYIFASDQCRSTFQSDPVSFIEPEAATPPLTEGQRRRGRELLERAAKAHGGRKLDAVRSWRIEARTDIEAKENALTRRVWGGMSGGAFLTEAHYQGWGAERNVLAPAGAFYEGPKTYKPLRGADQDALRRISGWQLLEILRARKAADLLAWSEAGHRVEVSWRGARVTLDLDPATGRVASASTREWGSRGLGPVERRFSDYREAAGLMLPHRVEATYHGKPWLSQSWRAESITVNADSIKAAFARTRPE